MCLKFHLQRLAQETFDRLLMWLREMKCLPLTTEESKPPHPSFLSLSFSALFIMSRTRTVSSQGKKWRITTFANTLALTSLLSGHRLDGIGLFWCKEERNVSAFQTLYSPRYPWSFLHLFHIQKERKRLLWIQRSINWGRHYLTIIPGYGILF